MEISLPTAKIESGIPFVLTLKSTGEPVPANIVLHPIGIQGATDFVAPVKRVSAEAGVVELALELPGTYATLLPSNNVTFDVHQRTDLSFGVEFGIFFVAVILLVGGMLAWLNKRKVPA